VTLTAGSGIEFTGANNTVIEVDLADTTPGLQFDANDDLQVIGNSVTQTGGDNDDPNITNGPSNIQITGGANITVTRNSDTELTIAAPAVTGGSTFRGTVDVDNDNTLPATTGQQNPNAVAAGDAFTVENNVAAATVTANWNTVLDNWVPADGIINSGDVILCTTGAAAGSPTNARYNLIRTGGNINTLQQVTDAGNTTTNVIEGPNGAEGAPSYTFDGDENTGIFRPAADTVGVAVNAQERFRVEAAGIRVLNDAGTALHQINANASAVFNETGADADFRVESVGNQNMLFVDAGENRVGIGTNTPAEPLEVNGNTRIEGAIVVRSGNDVAFMNAANNRSARINADDATTNATYTLPPAAGTAGQVLAIDTVTTGDCELEWTDVTVPVEEYTAITNAWDLDNDLLVSITAANQTVPIPTNQRNGQTGMLRLDVAVAWPAAGGAVFQYTGGAVPNITQFPAIIPYTVITTGTNDDLNNGVILWGSPTVNIT
jgi:hypothetical protein